MRRNALTAVAALALLATLLPACGSTATRLSKPDFTTKLDAACKARDKAINPLFDKNNPFSPQDAAKIWPKAETTVEDFDAKVGDLNAPKDAAFWGDYKDNIKKVESDIEDVIAASKKSDERAYSIKLSDVFDQFATVDIPPSQYGAKDCYDENNALPTPQKPAAGATAVDIAAKEYQFTIPSGIKAGKTAFKLSDKGNEMHMFALNKLKAGVTFDQLKAKALSNQDPSDLADDLGTTAFTGPGKSNILNADLTPGTYVAYCFISAPNGKPHLVLGMLQQFTVS